MNIAMFTNNYFPFIGGVPISIERQTRGLRSLGHTVHVFAPRYPSVGSAADDAFTHRFNLLTYYKSKVFDYAVVNIYSKKIEREFVKHGFDVVHVHHPFWMGSVGVRLGKKYGIPVVLTYHTRFDHYYHYVPFLKKIFKNIISHRIVKNFAERCDAVFAPSGSSRDYLAGLEITTPIIVTPTGIDLAPFEKKPDEKFRRAYAPDGSALLCSVSRLAREKNIFFLVECLEYLKNNHPQTPFRCVIIGTGPERAEIGRAIERAGLKDIVTLIGVLPPDEISNFYLIADVFVFASKSETQGIVLSEAMAGGCPVVAVASGGVNDIVTDGRDGFVTNDDAAEWAGRVAALLTDGEKRARMSANARESAKEFSLEAIAERAVRTYGEIAGRAAEGKGYA